MNLSLRLTEVKNTVEPCGRVADIGCDHGFVSIALVKEGRASKVFACDINKGPLEAAKRNIEAEGLEDRIETRLSDGLKKVSPDDAPECIVIAGMGGSLMTKILSEGAGTLLHTSQLVLQPQSEIFLVRQWLRNNGFFILKEKMLLDMGKYYWIIDARIGKEKEYAPDIMKIYDDYSGYLIQNKDLILREYLLKSLEANRGYLKGIEPSKQHDLQEKIIEIERALTMMA